MAYCEVPKVWEQRAKASPKQRQKNEGITMSWVAKKKRD